MNYAKRIVRAFDDGKIDQRLLDLWAKNTGGANPVARAKHYLKVRRIAWVTISLNAIGMFVTLGWPFSNQGDWMKAVSITSVVTCLLTLMTVPFLGYRSPSVKTLHIFIYGDDHHPPSEWLRALDELQAERARFNEFQRNNWKGAKSG